MKKILLCTVLLVLGGCAQLAAMEHRFPYMNQLVGHHISEVLDRLDGITTADKPRLMCNAEYLLFVTKQYSHTVTTYNYYGAILGQEDIYNRGRISLCTDSKGYIKRYYESGYIPVEGGSFDQTLRKALRDLIVFNN